MSQDSERPYFNYSTAQLNQLAQEEWQSTEGLLSIDLELQHRRRPAADRLRERIANRLTELISSTVEPKPHEGRTIDLYPWQKEAFEAWKANDCCGIVEAVTGSGKTRLAIKAIQLQLDASDKAVVVVPTVELMYQWKNEVESKCPGAKIGLLGNGTDQRNDNWDVLISSIHSASKSDVAPNTPNPLIIADEVHRFGANKFKIALRDKFSWRLGLSATWERADGGHDEHLLPYFRKVVYTLNFQNASDEHVIAPFFVATIGVDLDEEEREIYDAANEKVKRQKWKLINQFGAPSAPFGDFMKWIQQAKAGQIPGAERVAGIFWSAFQQRQKALSECKMKSKAALALTEAIEESDKTICFTMTKDSAIELASSWRDDGIEARAYHSGLNKDKRTEFMQDFRAGKIKVLVAPKVLDEGVDVADADLAIIFATSASRIQLVQRYGRVLRKKVMGTTARIAHLYVTDTPEDPMSEYREKAFVDVQRAANACKDFSFHDEIDDIIEFLSPN